MFEDIYLFVGISLTNPIFSSAFVTLSELFYGEAFEAFVVLSPVLLPIKSPVASSILWIVPFAKFLSASVATLVSRKAADSLHYQEVSSCIYCLKFYIYFYQCFYPHF